MGFIEGILIGFIAVFVITVYLLNERISTLSTALELLVKETNQHLKEIDYAFMSVSKTLVTITDAITGFKKPNSSSNVDKIKKNTERFLEISKITREQLDLYGGTQAPSSSASHSKYKNSISSQLKELEERKKTIMKEIIADGLDPEITMLDEHGEHKTMKMSEALKYAESVNKEPSTDQKSPRNKDGNVISLFKGDDDDDSNPGNSTLH